MNSRRHFLRQAAGSVLSLSLLPELADAANPAFAPPAQVLRVAMVGLGSYAERVADALRGCTMAKLVGGVTGTPAKTDKWAQKYSLDKKNFYNYENFEQIAKNPDIDAVYITLPNALHHEFVLRAAKLGKHVICEKPMSVSVPQAEEMVAVCKKAGVKLYIGYRLHFEPFTRELVRLRESGELGKIRHVNAYFGFKIGGPQWRLDGKLAGGGALMDVGIYCINAARYATGEEPLWISAEEAKTDLEKFKTVDETITWQMGFPSGVIASCATSYNFNFERLYVVGEKGWVELSPAYSYGPLVGKTHKGPMTQPVVTHQTLQMDGMANCLLNKAPEPNISGEEGLQDMKIVAAIYASIKADGKKIYLK